MIKITDLTFSYPGADRPALNGLNLQIPDGELCLVMGPSGSGKSTLLRCINGLVPHFSGGDLRGSIRVNGLDPARLSPREMSRMVGFVFQDPETQFVVDRVEDEIVFSLENAGLGKAEMESRVSEAMKLLELTPLRSRRLETLSGGEIQRVAIAAALALKPRILVLDEPTSQLDPHSAEEVLEALVQLNKGLGLTIILAEHRLERVLPHTGQIIYLSDDYPEGLSGTPRDVLNKIELNPPMIILGKMLGWTPLPLTLEEARECVHNSHHDIAAAINKSAVKKTASKQAGDDAFIKAHGVFVSFAAMQALRGVDLNLYSGEIAVMMGHNGAGKSTLLRALIGLTPLDSGSVWVDGQTIAGRSVADVCQQVGYLPQDPNALLFADTVQEELLITLRNHHLDPTKTEYQPRTLMERLGIVDKARRYPRDLSTGERQRTALGAVMVTHPGALLLDEPTRGLDYAAKLTLIKLLKSWREEGMAILMVTHDVELAVQAADRIILLENGQVSAEGVPAEVLAQDSTFEPQVAKIFPGRGWLTVNDVVGELDAGQY
jgi:energy-coupling factor transporter ATP-binding protein EcfA2